jgi:DNA-binding transcriptional regulator YbjK
MQPRQQRSQERRDAIVTAAAQIAADDGYAAISHRAVARRAEVPLGSTTYYFSSLDDLLGAVADVMVTECLARGAEVTATAPAGDYSPRDAARLLTAAILPGDAAPRILSYYEQLLSAARYEAVAVVLGRSRPQLEQMVADVLAKTGFADRVSPALALASVDGAALSALSEGHPDVPGFVRGIVTELLSK